MSVETESRSREEAVEASENPVESPLARLSDEQIEALGKEFDAIHDEVFDSLGERDAKYIKSMIEMHRRLVLLARAALVPSRFWPAWIVGTGRARLGEDPREHGDRPQRHARPVGLDEQPRDPLLDLGLGHRVDEGGVEALPQLRPPHLHEHPRQGQGPRLRDHADRPAPAVAPGLPAAAGLQRAADGAVRVGGRRPRPRLRRDPLRREVDEGGPQGSQGDRRQGPRPDRQGLHRLPGRSPV